MLIYFAGPLFSQAERHFNQQLTHKLEQAGFQVFLPQRDGPEMDKPPYNTMPREQWREAVFQIDKTQVLAADIFLFIRSRRKTPHMHARGYKPRRTASQNFSFC
jgi:nucleoside 2-deoxyribosyltransferase